MQGSTGVLPCPTEIDHRSYEKQDLCEQKSWTQTKPEQSLGQALLSQPPSFQQNSYPSSGSSAYQLWDLGNIYLSLWLKTYFQNQNAGRGSISGGNDLGSCLLDCRVSEMDVVAVLQRQTLFSQMLHWLLHPGLRTQQSAVQFLNVHEKSKEKCLLVELGVFSNRKCLWFLSLEVIPFLAPITTYPFV